MVTNSALEFLILFKAVRYFRFEHCINHGWRLPISSLTWCLNKHLYTKNCILWGATHLYVHLQFWHHGVNFWQKGHGLRLFFVASLKFTLSPQSKYTLSPLFLLLLPFASSQVSFEVFSVSVTIPAAVISFSPASPSLSLPLSLFQFQHPYLPSHFSLRHLFWLPASIFLSLSLLSLILTAIP